MFHPLKDAATVTDMASPTSTSLVLREMPISDTVSATPDFIIDPIETQDNAPMSPVPVPTPTCLSQGGQTAPALISNACSCLEIAPGTTTVVFTAPSSSKTSLPEGGNGTNGGVGTSIVDPSGRLHRTTRRHPRPSRGPLRFSTA